VAGLLFGIALYRAHVRARWAAALLAVGGIVSAVLALMPDAFYRLLAFPNGIAMIGHGYSLWLTTRTSSTMQPTDGTMPAPRLPPSDDSINRRTLTKALRCHNNVRSSAPARNGKMRDACPPWRSVWGLQGAGDQAPW
jgi:hypothetical protein